MVDNNIGGAQVFIKAAFEDPDVWGEAAGSMTEPNSTSFAFGQGVEVSIQRTNNKKRIVGVGNRDSTSSVALAYESTLNISGALTNAYWLLGVLGANADAGTGGAYTHTYTGANALPTFCAKIRSSFGTAKNEVFQGVGINQMTLKTSINEPVTFTLDCMARYDKIDTDSESAVTESEKVFTFAGGVIEIPDGTTIAKVQNIELTIKNTLEYVKAVGSRFAAGYTAKNREYDFKTTVAITDEILLSRFYDGSNSSVAPGTGSGVMADMQLTFTNSDGYTILITLTGIHFNEEAKSLSVGEVVKEDITGWATACTSIIYTNNTQTAPAQATNV